MNNKGFDLNNLQWLMCHKTQQNQTIFIQLSTGHNYFSLGASGVMVIVVGNGHGDTSSKPGRDWLHFT